MICAAVAPTFIGLCVYLFQQHDYLIELTRSNAQHFVRLVAQEERQLLYRTESILRTTYLTAAVRNKNKAECNTYLAALLEQHPSYLNFGVLSPSGELLCSGLPAVDQGMADRLYTQQAKSEPGIVVSQFLIGKISQRPTIVTALGFRNEKDELQSILYASMDVSVLGRGSTLRTLPSEARLDILDRNGIVLRTIPDNGLTGQPLNEMALTDRLAKSRHGGSFIHEHTDGEWLVSYEPAGPAHDPHALTIIYRHPTDAIFRDVNRAFWIGCLLTALLTFVAVALGWLGIQGVVGRPLKKLTEAVRQLAQRRFDTRTAHTLHSKEFNEIGRRFDEMAQELALQEHQWALSIDRQRGQNRILRMIAQNLSLDATLNALTQLLHSLSGQSNACIILLDTTGKRIETCFAPTLPDSFLGPMKQRITDWRVSPFESVISRRQLVVVPDISADPCWQPYKQLARQHQLNSCWMHPILAPDGNILGCLAIYRPTPHVPDSEDLRLSEMVTELASMAIEHRRQYDALRYQSRYDPLTGLINRNVLDRHLKHAVRQASKNSTRLFVMLVELDGFKEINLTLGHHVGDELLRQVAQRIQSLYGTISDVARSGSNEFALLLPEPRSQSPIDDVVKSLLEEIRRPFMLDGVQVSISASIGIAIYPESSTDPSDLLRHADSAMQLAKQEGRGHAFYKPAKRAESNRILLLSELRHALNHDQFVLHYQPKIHLPDGRVTGFEALLRWRHPEHGLMPPAEFITAIEFSDLIHPVTLWVLENAVEQCKAWQVQGFDISIAVNISARNLVNVELPERLREVLERHKLAPASLELEITESAIMRDPGRALDVLERIHQIGVRIAIDDFGTGHSSLAYLQKLPVDNLKIDRSFIKEMLQSNETMTIVTSIIALAHYLQINVTAEGVENNDILRRVSRMRCDYAQGYQIARPMPAEDVGPWLDKHLPR
ncbi:EAL domain-containing protein [Pusillimonas sp. CC-YST705]|uniref:EAL domain-containing protein n=1 Tax=Mesopusillimonas faecipullorum TaxID=2755040 RepID=A0ABS8CEN3_9BURK|nr:EAL domain-containing protein [Mesopusillimonas faecipullorum]MCB5364501.1 EAL domain-containing protein [Mesopusillimonas faecipullorum]